MPRPWRPGSCTFVAPYRFMVLLTVGVLGIPFHARAEWEIDWDLIRQAGGTVLREVQDGFDGRHVRALLAEADIDWTLTGRYMDRMLQGRDWESLALLHPYADALLDVLEEDDVHAGAADWLRQRIDYLAMADRYVQREREATAATPSPSPPVRQVPPPSTARVRPPFHWDAETRDWLARIPAEPSVFAQNIVPDLKHVFEGEGIPAVLVWLAEVESSFNPHARSPAGAVGLFQFMPATAGRFGLRLEPVDQRVDPLLSARAAARYLRILYRQFDDWQLALAAYNAGEGRVGRILAQSGGTQFGHIADRLPLETRMYVPRIAALVHKREQVDIRFLPAPL